MTIRRAKPLALHLLTPGFAAVLTLALAGCATPVSQSSIEPPASFATAPADSQQEPELAWWDSFGDPVLSDLVRRAASENRDIRIAVERVRAARAGETISRSALLPSIGASVTGTDSSTGRDATLQAGQSRTRAVPLSAWTSRGKST